MKGKLFLLIALSLGFVLTGCNKLKMQHPDSSVATHNICYELRQKLYQNESANVPDELGKSPMERARILQEYRKYRCAEQEVIRH